jgi:predicted glycoside hydrolase/deacetylase ChbG (UPF0249 family)
MGNHGMSATDRIILVVNADDFGLSDGVNRGIVEAHERGIVTSASLMVRQPAAAAAADYARGHKSLGVGLHLDLGEWEFKDGVWTTVYELVPHDDAGAVARELDRQITEFSRLMGDATPTHIDSHQHVHRHEPVRSVAIRLANQLRIPLRGVTPGVRFCGDFYGQDGRGGMPAHELISVEALKRLLGDLVPGVTELGCHPGFDANLRSCYRRERELEVRALCDAEVRAILDGRSIQLRSFAQLEAVA